jgi:hypothetical protein
MRKNYKREYLDIYIVKNTINNNFKKFKNLIDEKIYKINDTITPGIYFSIR